MFFYSGLKKARAEARKIQSSTSGKHYLLLSGLKQSQLTQRLLDEDDPGENEGGKSSVEKRNRVFSRKF